MNRRQFLEQSLALAGITAVAASCRQQQKIKGRILGATAGRGHMLRDKQFGEPARKEVKEIVIIGAGISGLSAGRKLAAAGIQDFVLLDLEPEPGGNSRSGSNTTSAYPLGAHYIPTPNNDLKEYLQFLESSGVITGWQGGIPTYNEEYLCFTPQERLYIHGRWQDGLVPHYGLPQEEQDEISRFLQLMDDFRKAKGSDGKDAFAIPADASSTDPKFTQLDALHMLAWMEGEGFRSKALHWYVDYCTRDDYGTHAKDISAWMGIHYFASRKGTGTNADHSDVLTWPEGNAFLAQALAASFRERVITNALAVGVTQEEGKITIKYLDVTSGSLVAIEAKHCILAVPQFVAARLLGDAERISMVRKEVQYAPWMVANLTVNELEERSGAPPSWDNVIYNGKSLGYVEATHNILKQHVAKKNLTYYLPLAGSDTVAERRMASEKSVEEWTKLIIDELTIVHPNIATAIEEITIQLWGHAMAKPVVGWVTGSTRKQLGQSLGNIHFAHTDLAGGSIFEEAFYQGIRAADKIIGKHV